MPRARSIFSKENSDFSSRAHTQALTTLYPHVFRNGFEIKDLFATDNDFDKGQDHVFTVGTDIYAVKVTVQERFRRIKYAKYRQITMTTYDHRAGFKGELYKIEADILVYGYYDDKTKELGECIVVSVPHIKMALSNGTLEFEQKTHYKQNRSFIAIDFDALERAGTVLYHYIPESTHEDKSMNMTKKRVERAEKYGELFEFLVWSEISYALICNEFKVSKKIINDTRRAWYYLHVLGGDPEEMPSVVHWIENIGPFTPDALRDRMWSGRVIVEGNGLVTATFAKHGLYAEKRGFTKLKDAYDWTKRLDALLEKTEPKNVLGEIDYSIAWVN